MLYVELQKVDVTSSARQKPQFALHTALLTYVRYAETSLKLP